MSPGRPQTWSDADSDSLGGAWDPEFLTRSHVPPVLPVRGPHFEKHSCLKTALLAGSGRFESKLELLILHHVRWLHSCSVLLLPRCPNAVGLDPTGR